MEDGAKLGGVEATRVSTRAVDKERIHDQRRRASQVVDSMPKKQRRSSTMALGPLEALPKTQSRMSQIGSIDRAKLQAKVETATKRAPAGSLEGRLGDLGLAMHTMDGDGNCQFRSFAFNLFGTQEEHAVVREAAVAHMRNHSDYFGMFFDGDHELKRYLKGMARPCTWGDELTLRAVVDAYGCVAHVVTSEPANWYLKYEPESGDDRPTPPVPRGVKKPPRAGKEVFLSYISPIHYNAIVAGAR